MNTAQKYASPEPNKQIPTILVVEDHVLVRLALAEYLRDCGYRVVEAGNAEEALEILQSNAGTDLVFTDIELSGPMNGFGLAHWVRKNRPAIRVVLTSGNSGKAEEARELCLGEPFFVKPYRLGDLGAWMATLLFSRQQDE